MKLFVYGTLRRGQPAHGLLAGAPLIDCVWTEPEFKLVDAGGYPALVEGGSTRVRGEIYEVELGLLPALDEYEDCPRLYQRVVRAVAGHEVALYALPPECALGLPELPHGDWCEARAARRGG